MVTIAYQNEKIMEQILEKKMELQRLVSINGLSNTLVLKCSQELDILIFQMQLLDKRAAGKDYCQYQESEFHHADF